MLWCGFLLVVIYFNWLKNHHLKISAVKDLVAVGVLETEEAVFTCTVTGYTGTPTVTWWKGTTEQTSGLKF